MAWIVKKVARILYNKETMLRVEGVNEETTNELDRRFSWRFGRPESQGLSDARYDYTGATFEPGAKELFDELTANAARHGQAR